MSRVSAINARLNRPGGAKSVLEARRQAKLEKKVVESESDSDSEVHLSSDSGSGSDKEKEESDQTVPSTEEAKEEEEEVPWYLLPPSENEEEDEEIPTSLGEGVVHYLVLPPVDVPYFPEKKKVKGKSSKTVGFADDKIGKYLYVVYPFSAYESPIKKRDPEITNSFKHRSKLKAQWVQEKASWISQKKHFQDRLSSQRSASSFLEQRRMAREQKMTDRRKTSDSDSDSGSDFALTDSDNEEEKEEKGSSNVDEKVVSFMKENGIEDELKLVEHLSYDELISLTKEQVDGLGLRFGPKKKLQTAISAKQSSSSSSSSSSSPSPSSLTAPSTSNKSVSPTINKPSTTTSASKYSASSKFGTAPASSVSSMASPKQKPTDPATAAVLAATSPSSSFKSVYGTTTSSTTSTPSTLSTSGASSEVSEFFEKIKMKQHINHFSSMTMIQILALTEEDLKPMGIPFMARKTIITEIEKAKSESNNNQSSTSTSSSASTKKPMSFSSNTNLITPQTSTPSTGLLSPNLKSVNTTTSGVGTTVTHHVTITPTNPHKLEEWLKDIGLNQYLSVFQSKGIDYEGVKNLDEESLKALALPFGPRKKLATEIAKLK